MKVVVSMAVEDISLREQLYYLLACFNELKMKVMAISMLCWLVVIHNSWLLGSFSCWLWAVSFSRAEERLGMLLVTEKPYGNAHI